MIKWIDNEAGWDGSLPVVLVAIGLAPEERGAALHGLAARALDLPLYAVAVERVAGGPPVLVKPSGCSLHLSSSSRGSFTAVAIAASEVGVDAEVVDNGGEIPWNVLHSQEAAGLMSVGDQARSFARLWSLKEAYLKALGTGLSREPSSFAVKLVDEERAGIEDPLASTPIAEARTTWRAAGPHVAAVSVVILRSRTAG